MLIDLYIPQAEYGSWHPRVPIPSFQQCKGHCRNWAPNSQT